VRDTVDAAIATAKRRKLKHVGVVLDAAGGASSNRTDVSSAYALLYGNLPPVDLTNDPGTNFNGYEIWNKDGDHPAVIVWTNDDPEAT